MHILGISVVECTHYSHAILSDCTIIMIIISLYNVIANALIQTGFALLIGIQAYWEFSHRVIAAIGAKQSF